MDLLNQTTAAYVSQWFVYCLSILLEISANRQTFTKVLRMLKYLNWFVSTGRLRRHRVHNTPGSRVQREGTAISKLAGDDVSARGKGLFDDVLINHHTAASAHVTCAGIHINKLVSIRIGTVVLESNNRANKNNKWQCKNSDRLFAFFPARVQRVGIPFSNQKYDPIGCQGD